MILCEQPPEVVVEPAVLVTDAAIGLLPVIDVIGGEKVAERLTRAVGSSVDLLGQVPLETALREGGDSGEPVVLSAPESASGRALRAIADKLAVRRRGLAGGR